MSTEMNVAYVVVTAAGMGTRLGWNLPKALVPVAKIPMLVRTLDSINRWAAQPQAPTVRTVVTAPKEYLEQFQELVSCPVVAGGDNRQASVYAGLKALLDPDTFNTSGFLAEANTDRAAVLIHDAARCLTPPDTFQAVFQAISQGVPAVVPTLPLVDTVRSVAHPDSEDAHSDMITASANPALRLAGGTLNRSDYYCVQTPQGFRGDIIFAAHESFANNASAQTWDDALLVQENGGQHFFLPGSETALKITTAFDLEIANYLASKVSN